MEGTRIKEVYTFCNSFETFLARSIKDLNLYNRTTNLYSLHSEVNAARRGKRR